MCRSTIRFGFKNQTSSYHHQLRQLQPQFVKPQSHLQKRRFNLSIGIGRTHINLLTPVTTPKHPLSALITSQLITTTPKTHKRAFTTSAITMGRENILHYLQEHNETDKELELSDSNGIQKPQEIEIPQFKRKVTAHSNLPFTLSPDSTITDYLNNNKFYVDSIKHNHGNEIFDLNGKGQSPHTLWIGCSDSRAGEQCLATLPGEIFVHRNIANIVNSNDFSSQGVIQFAVDVLKVKKIIVCGHTDCGGIWASLSSKKIGGVLDLWLNPVRHIRAQNLKLLEQFNHDPKLKAKKLAELNVIASVTALKRHPSASAALRLGKIEVWGMIYDVATGYLSEVEIPQDEFHDLFHVLDEEDESAHNPH